MNLGSDSLMNFFVCLRPGVCCYQVSDSLSDNPLMVVLIICLTMPQKCSGPMNVMAAPVRASLSAFSLTW